MRRFFSFILFLSILFLLPLSAINPPSVSKSPCVVVKQRDDLKRAVSRGDVRTVRQYLQNGLSPNFSFDGKTLLMHAALRGKTPLAQLLVARGATVDKQDREGVAALGWAARNGHADMIKFLADSGADVNKRSTSWGRTPLMSAAMGGHVQAVKTLLGFRAAVDAQDFKRKRTPLLWTIRMTAGSVKKKAAQISQDKALAVIALLVAHGADVNIRDYQEKTPLQRALMNGQDRVAKLLRRIIASGKTSQDQGVLSAAALVY